jgi:beta-lactamase regulating signal transducer with metallopeptidase domain/thiol-disulfide isomerase/thioredoxin
MTTASFWGALDSAGFQAVRVLVSLLWQSSIFLLAAGGLTWLLRRRRASVRHLIWVMALVAVPLLPLLAWLGASVGAPQAKLSVMPAYAMEPVVMPIAPLPTAPMPAVDLLALPAPPPLPQPRFTFTDYPWALGLLAYATGALLFLFLVLLGRYRISRWMAGGSVVADERVLGAFGEAGRQLGLNRRPLILATAQVQAPLTIGALRPAVLLPAAFEGGLSDAELRAVALHECAHIRRRDPLVLSLASLLRAVLFFHPLVWLACRQISFLAEQAADDAVLDATGEPIAYAKMLARLAENLRRRALTTELAAGIVLSKSAFLRRVEAILSDRRDSLRRLSRRALALTILAALLSLFLASALPLSEKQSPPTKQENTAGVNEPTPASNVTEVNLEPIFETIRQREARVKTLKYVWTSKESIPKGSMTSGDPAMAAPMPPEDAEIEQTYTMWLEGALVRIEERGQVLDENTGKFGPYEDTSVLGADGVERELWHSAQIKPSALVGPLRHIPAGVQYQAVLQAYRLMDPVLGKVSPSEVRFVGRAEQQGHPCILIERQYKLSNSSWFHRWWLAEDMAYSVLRWEDRRENGEPMVQLDMQYAPDDHIGWRLMSWSLTLWPGPQREPVTRKNVATEVLLNETVALGTFSITFPPGTEVSDRFSGKVYIVGAQPETYPAPVEGSMSFAERVLRVRLQWRLLFYFTDAPLADVLNFVHGVAGIHVVLDPQLQAEQEKLKVTISMKDTSTEDALSYITTALNLEWAVRDGSVHISPKSAQALPAAPEAAAPWGKAVQGVQCRLRADKATWKEGEVPTFKADIRNLGIRDLSVAQGEALCELEVDGQWYQWVGGMATKSSWFRPGRAYEDIAVSLVRQWGRKSGGQALSITPGKHTVLIAFLCDPLDHGGPVRAESNPVEVQILAPEVVKAMPRATVGEPALPTASDVTVRAPLTAAEQALRDKLAQHVTFSLTDTPLDAVVDFFRTASDANIVLDQRVRGGGDRRVTLSLTDVALEDALGLIVKAVEFDWTIYKGVVFISEESRLKDLQKREQWLPEVEPGNEATQAKLDRAVTLSFTDTPLDAAVGFFHQASDMNIVLDQRVRADAGPVGKRVSLTLTNVPLKAALDIMLTMLDLHWTVRRGAIFISDLDGVLPEPTLIPYDIKDLVGRVPATLGDKAVLDNRGGTADLGELAHQPLTAEALVELIRREVFPETWEAKRNSMSLRDGNLIVINLTQVQNQITRLLDALRGADIFSLRALAKAGETDAQEFPDVRTGEAVRLVPGFVVMSLVDLDPAQDVSVEELPGQQFSVNVALTPQAAERFHSWTQAHVRDQVAVLVNGTVWSVSKIVEPVRGPHLIVTAPDRRRAEEFAESLRHYFGRMRKPESAPSAAVGSPAPQLVLEEGTWTLAQFKGRPVVLAFVSIYSKPCVKVLEDLKALQEKQGADKLGVIAVHDRTATPEEIEQFRKEHSIAFPIVRVKESEIVWSFSVGLYPPGVPLFSLRVPPDALGGWDSATFRAYGITALPIVVHIDAKGAVASLGDREEEPSTPRQGAELTERQYDLTGIRFLAPPTYELGKQPVVELLKTFTAYDIPPSDWERGRIEQQGATLTVVNTEGIHRHVADILEGLRKHKDQGVALELTVVWADPAWREKFPTLAPGRSGRPSKPGAELNPARTDDLTPGKLPAFPPHPERLELLPTLADLEKLTSWKGVRPPSVKGIPFLLPNGGKSYLTVVQRRNAVRPPTREGEEREVVTVQTGLTFEGQPLVVEREGKKSVWLSLRAECTAPLGPTATPPDGSLPDVPAVVSVNSLEAVIDVPDEWGFRLSLGLLPKGDPIPEETGQRELLIFGRVKVQPLEEAPPRKVWIQVGEVPGGDRPGSPYQRGRGTPNGVTSQVTATVSVDAGPFACKAEELMLEVN